MRGPRIELDINASSNCEHIPSRNELWQQKRPLFPKPWIALRGQTSLIGDLQNAENAIIGGLGLVVGVEQKWVVARAPGVLVGDTPDGDTNTLGDGQASLDDGRVVVSGSASNIELGDTNINASGSELSEGLLDGARLTGLYAYKLGKVSKN